MHKKYSILPFFVFLVTFVSLNVIYADYAQGIKDNFPIFAVFLGIIASFFTFPRGTKLQEKIDVFVNGSGHPIIMHMCYIFMFSTIFTHTLDRIGAVESVVNISLYLVPAAYMLPGLFFITSLFSITIGSSMGAIVGLLPIALKVAASSGISIPLMTGTIICGAIFGDNLSIISDTTISAVKITRCSMKKKLRLNALIAIPAFILSMIMLVYQNSFYTTSLEGLEYTTPSATDLITVLPYILVFTLAFIGYDILVALVAGIIAVTALGFNLGSFTLSEALTFVFDGFYESKGIVHVFVLVIFLSGLSRVVAHNGGIDYVLKRAESHASQPLHARIIIFLLVCLVNCATVINTISIIITGPIANKIGNKYNLPREEVATILDVGSCITQGILPYTPQILLASSMAGISALSILPHLWYQYMLLVSLLGYFLYRRTAQ